MSRPGIQWAAGFWDRRFIPEVAYRKNATKKMRWQADGSES